MATPNLERLHALLLPGTPPAVVAAYEGLAHEAERRDFGALERDLVVLDTETTGLNFKNDRLTEIAAVRLCGREVVASFQTLVDPEREIPAEIVALTGITNDDVAGAPKAERCVRDLARFAQGARVVAHNATFDRTFIERVEGGEEVSDRWVDSLMFSRIALPRLRSHALAKMAEAFGISPVTHRAMADVEALSGMWRIWLCGLDHLPKGLLARFADSHREVTWPYRYLFDGLASGLRDRSFSLVEERKRLVSSCHWEPKRDAREAHEPLWVDEAEVERAFEPGGIVAAMYPHYEPREAQVEMAGKVASALGEGKLLAVEAATGTGKSMAYLLPLAMLAKGAGITCGVATKTNALSDQLVTTELPALDRVLPGGVGYVSLKGYEHYPCLRRVERALVWDLPAAADDDNDHYQSDILSALAVSLAASVQAPLGDLDALGIRWRFVPRTLLTTTPDECLRGRCPFYGTPCLLHGARIRAQSADIVVTNHSLLLRDVDLGGKILPPIRHWVVDEAQGFEAEARSQWALEASAARVRQSFESLGNTKTGAIHALLVQAAAMEGARAIEALLAKASAQASRAQVLSADFFDAIDAVMGRDVRRGQETVELLIDDDLRAQGSFAALSQAGRLLRDALIELIATLEDAQRLADSALGAPTGDLQRPRQELMALADALLKIFVEDDDDRFSFLSIETARGSRGCERAVSEVFDVGEELAHRWYPEVSSVVFCSGTLAVGRDFERFGHAVGLDWVDAERVETALIKSSYDFESLMTCVRVTDLPEQGDPSYVRKLVDLLYDVHVAMGGSVLTLFTNRRDMERVYRQLRPRLRKAGLELSQQDRNANIQRLRDRFVRDEKLSLLALRSFWEGIDASGDTLRCVVVPKMPFENPNDPLVRERERRDASAFWRYSLPDATLQIRQAAGRLIRSSTDRGIFIIADSRLGTRRYGPRVMRSLPSGRAVELAPREVGPFIERWVEERQGGEGPEGHEGHEGHEAHEAHEGREGR